MTSDMAVYRTFPSADHGGKRVAVFADAAGDLQQRAALGEPLSVFVEGADVGTLQLRVYTPVREKRSSDSAAVAALTWLSSTQSVSDLMQVEMGGETFSAQLCGGEWLLRQGVVTVEDVAADLSPIGLAGRPMWTARTERPNLVVEVTDLAALDAYTPDADAISALNRATGTTGLIVFTPGGPNRADVSFRAFGPLKGFVEDAASSNMLACLVGVLGRIGHLPTDTNLLTAAQRMPGAPSRLTVQFDVTRDGVEVWVGGRATAWPQPTVSSVSDD
ncbi:PhzF family phenazine biosynthesis protein [Deinococcus sp. KSM4-11]|uniref:PhzF family phenazine biosynthesis protein n=1 Tax=Deinococcus sp. KSM4-11 TaxID=2568654 RepID=UPI0010A363B7|nr:PhzF family phenazine biosynthesis protein [Deinococcus sp. KSM4-11]THF88780.1 PhzF family phenazine biosynthesis protein [Deinococcus sp. KSM4-11]